MIKYKLNKEHTFKGQWWLPNTEQKVYGELCFDKNSFSLELDGSFQQPKEDLTEYNQKIKYPIIYGECKGILLTLYGGECWGTAVSILSTSALTEKIKARFLLVGQCSESDQFNEASFYTPGLQAFMCHLVLKEDVQLSPEFKINLQLSKNEKINYEIPSISSNIEFGYFWSEHGKKYKNKIIETGAVFTIKPNDSKGITWFLEQRKKVTMWLTFLSGYGMSPDAIDCSTVQEGLKLMVALPDQHYCSVDHPTDLFINKNSFGENFENRLNDWFNLFETSPNFKIPCALAFEILSEKVTRAHFVDYLNIMQALEGIHRAFYKGKFMQQSEYDESVYPEILQAVPDIVGTSHRSSLRSRLKFGNEISLIKRLNQLANEFNDEIKEILFGKQKKAIKPWVDTRNYFTHRDEVTKTNVLEGAELYEAIVKLRGFLRLTILRLMGVSQDLMLTVINNNSYVSRELKQFK